MQLIKDWKPVLKKSWSAWLTALAAVLSGVEVSLSVVGPETLGVTPGLFAALAGVTSALAVVARVLSQRGIETVVTTDA
jgi:hypothetical protein